MIKVTFKYTSSASKKEYISTELFRSMEDANLRALALNMRIVKTEAA
jgi:hypothetical protein